MPILLFSIDMFVSAFRTPTRSGGCTAALLYVAESSYYVILFGLHSFKDFFSCSSLPSVRLDKSKSLAPISLWAQETTVRISFILFSSSVEVSTLIHFFVDIHTAAAV